MSKLDGILKRESEFIAFLMAKVLNNVIWVYAEIILVNSMT